MAKNVTGSRTAASGRPARSAGLSSGRFLQGGDGLAQAVQVIETACDDFEEPDPNDPGDDEDCEIDVDTGECENDDGSGGGNGGVD